MTKLSNIVNPSTLIENNHLDFYNIEFDDISLNKFIIDNKDEFTSLLVTNMKYTQELSDNQKNMIKETFPNIIHFNHIKN